MWLLICHNINLITIITLPNNKTKKEKQRSKRKQHRKKKNCPQQSRRAEEGEEKKEKERARSHLDYFPWGLCIPSVEEEEDKSFGSAKLLEEEDKLFLIFNPTLVNPG